MINISMRNFINIINESESVTRTFNVMVDNTTKFKKLLKKAQADGGVDHFSEKWHPYANGLPLALLRTQFTVSGRSKELDELRTALDAMHDDLYRDWVDEDSPM